MGIEKLNKKDLARMKIEFQFPDMESLHAHSKGNFWGKSKATSTARSTAKFICLDLINRKQAKPIVGPVLVSYSFFVPDNIRRDAANMIQAMKGTIDGIVDSGLIEGDHWQMMSIYNVHVDIDRKNPRVELRIHSTMGCGDLMATKEVLK